MKTETVQLLLNVLDPLEIIEVAPPDEYESEAKSICGYLKENKFSDIEYCVQSLYDEEYRQHEKQTQDFIKLLKILNDKV